MEENLGESEGKMGYGVMRYSPNEVTCVIDSRHVGKQVNDVVDMPRNCPVVANVEEAHKLGADVLVLGVSGHPDDEVVGRVVEGREQQGIDPRVLPVSRRGPLDAAMYGSDARLAVDAYGGVGARRRAA